MKPLKRDTPKFLENSRVITEVQKQWWDHLFTNAETIYAFAPKKPSLRCSQQDGKYKAQASKTFQRYGVLLIFKLLTNVKLNIKRNFS